MNEFLRIKIDDKRSITVAQLRNADKEFKIKVMRDWFYHHFEKKYTITTTDKIDKVQKIPSREFGGIVNKNYIRELSSDIDKDSLHWLRKPRWIVLRPTVIEDFGYDVDFLPLKDCFKEFNESIKSIISLINDSAIKKIEHKNKLHCLLYSNIFTTLETYLGDLFNSIVTQNTYYMEQYIRYKEELTSNENKTTCLCGSAAARTQTTRNKRTKFKYADKAATLKLVEKLKTSVEQELLSISWNNMSASSYFKNVLDINFPPEYKSLFDEDNSINLFAKYSPTKIRNLIVHRNGKLKDGNKLYIQKKHLHTLISRVKKITKKIHLEIKEKMLNWQIEDFYE